MKIVVLLGICLLGACVALAGIFRALRPIGRGTDRQNHVETFGVRRREKKNDGKHIDATED